MLKKNLLFMLFGLMAMFLMACGGGGEEAQESETLGEDIEGATELTLWTFTELHNDFYSAQVDRWNEENPDRPISLTAETYPYDNMHNNLLLALQSGEGAPDIADIEISRFPNYLAGEPQLMPMNEYVEPVIDDFVESRFDIYAKDGNYYGMPTHVGATVMYYNEEIMTEAGVDIDAIQTWDDYVEAGQQVVENTDAMMTAVPTGDFLPIWAQIIQKQGDFLGEDGAPTANSDAVAEVMQFNQDLIYEYEIAEIMPGGAPHAEEFYAYMIEGGAASVLMPMWYMTRFMDYMPELEGQMEIRPLPAWEEGGNRSAGLGGTGTVVTNQSENPELAQEFLAFAKLSEEANIALWQVLGFDPPMWTVWEMPELQEGENAYFEYFSEDIFEMLLTIREEIDSPNIGELTPAVATEVNTNVLPAIIRDQAEVGPVLESAQEALLNQ